MIFESYLLNFVLFLFGIYIYFFVNPIGFAFTVFFLEDMMFNEITPRIKWENKHKTGC